MKNDKHIDKLSRILVIAKKEIRSIRDEKTIILAILLQLFIAMFSSFLMVSLSAMYDPSAYRMISNVETIGYSGNDTLLFELLERNRAFVPYHMEPSVALGALAERKLSAVLILSDVDPAAKEPVLVTMYTIKNDIQSTVTEVALKEVLLEYEEILRDIRQDRFDFKPIKLSIPRPVNGTTFYEFIYGLLIPLLLFMPAIISAGLVIDQITEEYQQQTIDTLFSSPVSPDEMVFGKVLASFILVPLQAVLWLFLLTVNGIQINGLFEILLYVTFTSALLILIAAAIAQFFCDRTKVQFIFSTSVIILILLGLSFQNNPINLIVILASGLTIENQWLMMIVIIMLCAIMFFVVRKLSYLNR